MIEFYFRFKELYTLWQKTSLYSYSLTQIAEQTQTTLPYVIKYLSESLSTELEITRRITLKEAKVILEILSQKHKNEIEERTRFLERKTQSVILAHQKNLEKADKLQLAQKWDHAFRTLSYFAGEHEEDLPKDLFVNLCSNIVRSGIKSENINLQEISRWLRKGVERNLKEYNQESLKDALDLIETYSLYFQREPSGKGKLVLIEILGLVETPACDLHLWQTYKTCVDNLFFAH